MAFARVVARGVALVVGAAVGPAVGPAQADVIHLRGGTTVEVDAWRDAGDAIEFTRFGGIIRIAKADVVKIEGSAVKQDLRMYSAPASASGSAARIAADRAAAVKDMTEVLDQGEGLFGQTVLSAQSKADAFRRLGQRWRDLAVPEPFRELHGRGQAALQMAAEAYTAEDEGQAPDVKERIEAARKAVQDARGLVKKAAEEPS
jgi:hypothetical protein